MLLQLSVIFLWCYYNWVLFFWTCILFSISLKSSQRTFDENYYTVIPQCFVVTITIKLFCCKIYVSSWENKTIMIDWFILFSYFNIENLPTDTKCTSNSGLFLVLMTIRSATISNWSTRLAQRLTFIYKCLKYKMNFCASLVFQLPT